MKLKLEPTERGFLRADFKDDLQYNCSIQESNLKDEKCLWLGINEGIHAENGKPINHKEFTDLGMNCLSRMHLTQEIAGELAKQLAYFARKGKLRTEKQTIENPYINKLLVSTEPHFSRKRYYLGMVESTILSKDIAIQFENRPYQRLRTERIKTLTTRLENIIKWLSEGQQGFYTPNGLVKEL